VVAFPLETASPPHHVAVATFVTRRIGSGEDLSRVAEALDLDSETLMDWGLRQVPWMPEALDRVCGLVMGRLEGLRKIEALTEEAESLSINLASTYEEISLLYRLTQNLKISTDEEELFRVALTWLIDVLPAEGVGVHLLPLASEEDTTNASLRTENVLLVHGNCRIDEEQFGLLVDHLELKTIDRPLVANLSITQGEEWPCPEIRQMIAVPLSEGDNLFGWLAAFNHIEGGEFGTVEASLLSSVATILGIHSGNTELYRQQAELMTGIIRALTSAIDAKDPYTRGHSDRVARVAVRLAEELDCDAQMRQTIYLSGLLHDIGKIGISDSVLRKPGKLDDEEYEHIKCHTQIGHRILLGLKKLDDVLPVVLHHHESWDGHGYPHRLPSETIPLPARIVAVADSFDAMSSDRPYRKGMADEKINAIFRDGSGKQWDPAVVEAFFRAREDINEIIREEQSELQVMLEPSS